MSDTVKVRGGWHPESLASGRTVVPGELFDRSALNLDDPHDARLVDEGIIIEAIVAPAPLTGDALKARAEELGIPNRGRLSADELRVAVAKADAEAPPTVTLPADTVRRVGGDG